MKAFLLDQRRVAGVGNIYADEALFRAGIHPLRPAGPAAPRRDRAPACTASSETLERGIDRQGASIDDYRDSNGERGSMQDEFLIHLRDGRAVHPLRPSGDEDGRRRAGDLRLPPLPAGSAAAPPGADTVSCPLPDGFSVGHWTDTEAATGCTVVLPPPDGAVASGDVRGGGPGTREIDLLNPLANARARARGAARPAGARSGSRRRTESCAGSSATIAATTLRAAWCRSCRRAVVYDLITGDPTRRPGPAEGEAACEAARRGSRSSAASAPAPARRSASCAGASSPSRPASVSSKQHLPQGASWPRWPS